MLGLTLLMVAVSIAVGFLASRVSAAIGRRCVEGFADCRHIITGCSGCTLQLASAAPSGVTVRHWLDVVDISV